MLNWLKRRANKISINNRYVNLFRSNIQNNMFVSEPGSLINDQNIKLTVFNTEGHEYQLEISSGTTVQRVKVMAVGHFFGHLEAVGGHPDVKNSDLRHSKSNRTFRLVVVRGARPLADDNPLHFEKLINDDVLLLVERREAPSVLLEPDENSPTIMEIARVTAQLPKCNDNRDPDPTNTANDFQTEFRRILVTMIEASVRLISADPDSKEVFSQILEKLERRHRPKVDRNALRQLIEMGFNETRATKALQVKRTFNEAMEWLLEEGMWEDNDVKASDDSKNGGQNIDKIFTDNQDEDPAQVVLGRFLQYRKKWFLPNPPALQSLKQLGFPEDRIIEALRVSNNVENAAREILVDDKPILPDDQRLERDSPIISAILASPVIQLALPKPKTLLALMMLYESPNNANMWLSDPDTHPVVSQVLRIYHAEKHSLSSSGRSTSTTTRPTQSRVETTAPSDSSPRVSRSPGPLRNHSNTVSSHSRCPSPLPELVVTGQHEIRTSSGIISFPEVQFRDQVDGSRLPSSNGSLEATRVLPPSATTSVNTTIPNSPLPPSMLFQNEEPMSHSGSPVRGMVGPGGNEIYPIGRPNISNGGPQAARSNYQCHLMENPMTDIEMDDTNHDSQDMET